MKSPFLWTAALTLAAITVNILAFGFGLLSLPLAATIPTNAAAAGMIVHQARNRKWFLYESSLTYIALKNSISKKLYPWWHPINDQIVLGGIPLNNKNHLKKLQQEGIGSVLTIVEDFEWKSPSLMGDPTKPLEWQACGIHQKNLPSPDFSSVSQEVLQKGVAYMKDQIDQGHKIYVHCKAGVGRSATMVICYLVKFMKMSPQEAHAYVKSKRPAVNINSRQHRAILDFYNSLSLTSN